VIAYLLDPLIDRLERLGVRRRFGILLVLGLSGAVVLGVLLVAGTYVGAKLSGRLSGRGLTMAVALTLVAVGLWYGYATVAA